MEDGAVFDDIDGMENAFVFSKKKKNATECKLRKRNAKKTIYQQTANAQNEDSDGNEKHDDNEPQMILLPISSENIVNGDIDAAGNVTGDFSVDDNG